MKPHEETWEFVPHYQHIDVPEGGDIGIFVDDRVLDESEKARLRLAAQAPAMARMLLELTTDGYLRENGARECPSCHFTWMDDSNSHNPHEFHYDTCEARIVLRAAGVLP